MATLLSYLVSHLDKLCLDSINLLQQLVECRFVFAQCAAVQDRHLHLVVRMELVHVLRSLLLLQLEKLNVNLEVLHLTPIVGHCVVLRVV